MSKITVVTGGAGFIGSLLVRALNNRGESNILIVDNLESGDKWKNLVGKKFIEIVPISALFSSLEEREGEIGSILHMGAISATTETDMDRLLEVNTKTTRRLAEFSLTHGKRMVYASSAATYGDGQLGFSDDHTLLEALRPLNPYAFSKHLFDLWAQREGVLDQLTGIKYFNVFGPNEWHKGRMASTVLHFVPQVQAHGKISLFASSEPELYPDGGQMRDFIYGKDAAEMTLEFLYGGHTGIYNVGRGEPKTWNALANAVFKALAKPPHIEYIPMPKDLAGKYQNFTAADMTKTKRVLGKKGECSPLEDSVVDYVQNHLLPEARW